MASTVAYYKQHDLEPEIRTVGLLNSDGSPIPLGGASSVTFFMRPVGQTGAPTVNRTATIENAVLATVFMDWVTGDLDAIGTYNALWRINWPTSRYQSVPAIGYLTIVVGDDLTAG